MDDGYTAGFPLDCHYIDLPSVNTVFSGVVGGGV
jgi:hypothetical protein